jgi:hypothetical protein
MSNDPHRLIKEQMELDGYSDVDAETFGHLQGVKFLLSEPADRISR